MNIPAATAARPLHFGAIGASELSAIQQAPDRDHIGSLASRIWDKVIDFFCNDRREEAKKCLFDLYAPSTPDAQKIELFTRLRELSAPAYQDRFQYKLEDGRETYALLLDQHDPDAGVMLTRTAIGCDWHKIEAVLHSDRSYEGLEKQLRQDIVRAGYEVAGQPVPDDDTLPLGPRQDLRLQLLDAELAKLACTPEEVEAVHALAHQATFALIMQSTLAKDPVFAAMCPSSAQQYTAYGIQRENGALRLHAHCRHDVAAESDEELRSEKLQLIREVDNFYRSLEIRTDIAIDSQGQARLADLHYHGTK